MIRKKLNFRNVKYTKLALSIKRSWMQPNMLSVANCISTVALLNQPGRNASTLNHNSENKLLTFLCCGSEARKFGNHKYVFFKSDHSGFCTNSAQKKKTKQKNELTESQQAFSSLKTDYLIFFFLLLLVINHLSPSSFWLRSFRSFVLHVPFELADGRFKGTPMHEPCCRVQGEDYSHTTMWRQLFFTVKTKVD